jgi:Outer membrane lipoprotein-sorting protein
MKIHRIFYKSFILMISLFMASTTALTAETAKEIVIKTDSVSRDSYSSTIQKMKLTTCKYRIKNKKMKCVDTARTKVMESIQKDTGPDGEDSRSIAIILEPIGEKGIGMLTFDYDDVDRDADTWLYLSAMGKVKRMISSSEESDESGSFFGTEFSIEDMESRKIDDYTYKILKEGTYAGRPVWVVESTPTKKRARKSKYGKSQTWIDKERFIPLKVNLFNRLGKPYKQMTMKDIQLIDKVWVARKMTMKNLITRRVTNLEILDVAFNMEVPERFLTQRTLTDFAFRERELNKLRKHIQ